MSLKKEERRKTGGKRFSLLLPRRSFKFNLFNAPVLFSILDTEDAGTLLNPISPPPPFFSFFSFSSLRYFKSPTHLISFLSLLRTSLSINSTMQELEYNFNLDSSLDWLPKDSITKVSRTKDQDEPMKDPNQKEVEVNDKSTEVDDVTMDLDESEHSESLDSEQRFKEKTSSTSKESMPTSKEIPIPDFSKVTSQHERVLMFDRRPTLIILEGLTEMFQRGLNDEK